MTSTTNKQRKLVSAGNSEAIKAADTGLNIAHGVFSCVGYPTRAFGNDNDNDRASFSTLPTPNTSAADDRPSIQPCDGQLHHLDSRRTVSFPVFPARNVGEASSTPMEVPRPLARNGDLENEMVSSDRDLLSTLTSRNTSIEDNTLQATRQRKDDSATFTFCGTSTSIPLFDDYAQCKLRYDPANGRRRLRSRNMVYPPGPVREYTSLKRNPLCQPFEPLPKRRRTDDTSPFDTTPSDYSSNASSTSSKRTPNAQPWNEPPTKRRRTDDYSPLATTSPKRSAVVAPPSNAKPPKRQRTPDACWLRSRSRNILRPPGPVQVFTSLKRDPIAPPPSTEPPPKRRRTDDVSPFAKQTAVSTDERIVPPLARCFVCSTRLTRKEHGGSRYPRCTKKECKTPVTPFEQRKLDRVKTNTWSSTHCHPRNSRSKGPRMTRKTVIEIKERRHLILCRASSRYRRYGSRGEKKDKQAVLERLWPTVTSFPVLHIKTVVEEPPDPLPSLEPTMIVDTVDDVQPITATSDNAAEQDEDYSCGGDDDKDNPLTPPLPCHNGTPDAPPAPRNSARRIHWDSSLDMPSSEPTGVSAPKILSRPRYTVGDIPVDLEAMANDKRMAELIGDHDDDKDDNGDIVDAPTPSSPCHNGTPDAPPAPRSSTRRIHWDSSLDMPASEPTGVSAPKILTPPRYMLGDIPVDLEAMANDERMAELLEVAENHQREIDGPWDGNSDDARCYCRKLVKYLLEGLRPVDHPDLTILRCEFNVLEPLLPTMPDGVLEMLFSRLDKDKEQLGLKWELHDDFPDGLPVRRSCRLAKRPRLNYKE